MDLFGGFALLLAAVPRAIAGRLDLSIRSFENFSEASNDIMRIPLTALLRRELKAGKQIVLGDGCFEKADRPAPRSIAES
jgi:hypothetical protein